MSLIDDMIRPKLVSFKLCPFAQRSVITLNEKNIPFDIEYIDLANKPEWFLKISPFGRVPLLQVGEDILFESAVINEYLNEVTPPSLHPKDPLVKAKHRAWIEFASSLVMDLYSMTMTKEKVEYEKKQQDIINKISQLDQMIPNIQEGETFFSGNTFCLIDTSYAPFFMRLDFLKQSKAKLDLINRFVKIQNWSNSLLAKDSVKDSVLPEVPLGYLEYIKKSNSYLGSLL